jgi:hypothetical protein
MEENHIAPCGMNCNICSAYMAYKHKAKEKGLKLTYCTGCRPRNKLCALIKKTCRTGFLLKGKVNFCYECPEFPCQRLKNLDRRYVNKYGMSMIGNLTFLEEHGIEQFLAKEADKWRCSECGGLISCHNGVCYDCGLEGLRSPEVNAGKIEMA